MKKLSWKLFFTIALSGMMFACSDDPYYGEGYDSEYNRLYSNKSTHQPNTGILLISYSGGEVTGREVYFEMQDKESAKLKFYSVFPAEKEVTLDRVALTGTRDGYSISGTGTTAKGTTYKVSGSVKTDTLRLDLTDIVLPSNRVAGTYSFSNEIYSTVVTGTDTEVVRNDAEMYHRIDYVTQQNSYPFFLDWQVKPQWQADTTSIFGDDALKSVVDVLFGNLFYVILPEVTFHPDGNLTAKYASIAKDVEIMDLLFATSVDDSYRGQVKESPKNMVYYFVEGNKLYIQPDLDLILATVLGNNSIDLGGLIGSGDGGSDILGMLGGILPDLLDILYRWSVEGIEFTLRDIDPAQPLFTAYSRTESSTGSFTRLTEQYTYSYYKGKHLISTDELEFIAVLVPAILEMFDFEIENPALGMLLDQILNTVSRNAPYTTRFDVGFFLQNE